MIECADLAALKAANIVDGSAHMVDPTINGIFFWTAGDYAGLADDINIIKANSQSLSAGAWVRQSSDEITFRQAGTGAPIRTAQDKLQEIISVKDYGAVGDGAADDTAAFQTAIDVASSFYNTYTSIYVPPGLYRLTDVVRINKRYVRLFGAGDKSCLYFDPPATGRIMLLIQASDPTELINLITLESFGIKASTAALSYRKTGIYLVDASSVTIRNVNFVDYSWSGGSGLGSTALYLSGRDTHKILESNFIADQPIYVDKNPNSDQYTFDYHHFSGLYMQSLKSSNYAITFGPGVNPSNWIVDGDCCALQGKGGIYLNNHGTETQTSSMIVIDGFRCESGTASGGDANGYGIYMDFGEGNPPCGNIDISNSSVNDPTCNGYYIKNAAALTVRNVNCGFGTAYNGLVLTDVFNANIVNLGIGNSAAIVQLNSMYAQRLHKFAGSSVTDPGIAFGIFVHYAADSPGNNLVYENGVRKWARTELLANGDDMVLPSLDVDQTMRVAVSNINGAGEFLVRYADAFICWQTGGWGVGGSGVVSLVNTGSGNSKLVNASAGHITFVVETVGQ